MYKQLIKELKEIQAEHSEVMADLLASLTKDGKDTIDTKPLYEKLDTLEDRELDIFDILRDALIELSEGKIDRETAWDMLTERQNKTLALLEKIK